MLLVLLVLLVRRLQAPRLLVVGPEQLVLRLLALKSLVVRLVKSSLVHEEASLSALALRSLLALVDLRAS